MKSLSRIGKAKSRRLSPAALLLNRFPARYVTPGRCAGAGASLFHMEKHRKGLAKS